MESHDPWQILAKTAFLRSEILMGTLDNDEGNLAHSRSINYTRSSWAPGTSVAFVRFL